MSNEKNGHDATERDIHKNAQVATIVQLTEQVKALWQLLDDIDTEDDFCKDLDAVYRVRTRAIQKKRWAIWTPEPEGEPVTLLRSDASQPITEHDNLTGNGDGPLVMKVTPPTIDSDVINPFDGKAFPLEPAGDIALGSGPVLIKGVAHERLAGEDDEALRRRLSEPEGKVQS